MNTYPDDSLEAALRNTFDFDVYRKETIQKLSVILARHGFVPLCCDYGKGPELISS